jgi:hypothetical protein
LCLIVLLLLLLLLQSHARERKDIMAVSTLDELRDWLDEQSVSFRFKNLPYLSIDLQTPCVTSFYIA